MRPDEAGRRTTLTGLLDFLRASAVNKMASGAAGVSWPFDIHDPFCLASIAESLISVIPPRFDRYAFEIGRPLLA